MTDQPQDTNPMQGAGNPGDQAHQPAPTGGAPMPAGDQGGTPPAQDPQAEAERKAAEELKTVMETPPPEPRGSAYMNTDEFNSFATTVTIPEHPTEFNEKYFLYLFAGSLSLKIHEKRDIVGKIPTLSQFQIDELINILEEEKQKFDELGHKHPEQVAKLKETAKKEWNILEMETHQEGAGADDEEAADEIRKQLGL